MGMMDQIAVWGMRAFSRLQIRPVNSVAYILSVLLSFVTTAVLIVTTNVLPTILDPDSIYQIFISYASVLLFFTFYYLAYVYFKFFKHTGKQLSIAVLCGVLAVVLVIVYGWLSGYELVGELVGLFPFVAMIALAMGIMLILSLVSGWMSEHRINTHFESAINRLEKIQNNEINNCKDLYVINAISDKYNSGIEEVRNLLIRGIDPNGFFDSNTELSLNEILDLLTFSMQYYLFYGGPEQMEAVKNHLERMIENFDKEYHISANQFIHETLRMYKKMDIYFKENNIYIERHVKFTDRIISHSPQVLLAIVLLIISIITNNFILK